MHSDALKSFKVDLSEDRLDSLFEDFLGMFLGECNEEPSFILFTDKHRQKLIELADEAYGNSQYYNQIAEWSIAWENGKADAEQILSVYAFDHCRTIEQAEEHLREMKALPYVEFLKSDYWLIVRRAVIRRHNGKCGVCLSSDHLHVHHKSYDHHGEEHEHLEDLIPLCRSCHEKFHNKVPTPGGTIQ